MKDKEKISCMECGSKNVVKKGFRKTKLALKQVFTCRNCGKSFTLDKLKNKTYPINIIMNSVSNYNLGNNLAQTSKIIKKRFNVKVPEKTIYSWVKEFNEICSYYRIRKKAIKLYKPKDVIFKKIFRHLQLYKYRYHKTKIEFFVNVYFNGLKNYLTSISKNCPNELFRDSVRSSDIKLGVDVNGIKVFKKENYACKLASLALEAASKNSERHDKLQEFMLANDTCTIATEVPVYLFLDEIEQLGVLNLFGNSLKNNTLKIENNNENTSIKNNQKGGILNASELVSLRSHVPAVDVEVDSLRPPNDIKQNSAITGHIDFVQLKFGSVYVLDYKPDASKVDAVSQLFVYALALSLRTGIWLRNFRCAWFDENGYYEFVPSDVVLRFCNIPRHKFREFFVRNKERRYFTSNEFQATRKNDFSRKFHFLKITSHVSIPHISELHTLDFRTKMFSFVSRISGFFIPHISELEKW